MSRRSIALAAVLALAALTGATFLAVAVAPTPAASPAPPPAAAGAGPRALAKATFAGGCFWCMEPPFEKLDGVVSVTSGYTGGTKASPTYEEVSSGATGHTESVEVLFDPAKVPYGKLLEVYWKNVDPTTPHRQFCDVGDQYRPEIFVHDEAQRLSAEESKKRLEATKPFAGPVAVKVTPAGPFWPAEEYHQDYYKKNPVRYRFYRSGCGRDARLSELWGTSEH